MGVNNISINIMALPHEVQTALQDKISFRKQLRRFELHTGKFTTSSFTFCSLYTLKKIWSGDRPAINSLTLTPLTHSLDNMLIRWSVHPSTSIRVDSFAFLWTVLKDYVVFLWYLFENTRAQWLNRMWSKALSTFTMVALVASMKIINTGSVGESCLSWVKLTIILSNENQGLCQRHKSNRG